MLPTSREPRFTHPRRRHLSKTGFVLSGMGWHIVLFTAYGGVTQYMAICQTFTLQTAGKVGATSAYRSTCHPRGERKEKIHPPPAWAQSMRLSGCLTCSVVLRGGVPGPGNCLVEDTGKLTSCSLGSKKGPKGRPRSIRSFRDAWERQRLMVYVHWLNSQSCNSCGFYPQHTVSSVWQVHTVVLHHLIAFFLALFLSFCIFFPPVALPSKFLSQVQQSRSTWQKRWDWFGRDVEVEGSDREDEVEEAVVLEEARSEG